MEYVQYLLPLTCLIVGGFSSSTSYYSWRGIHGLCLLCYCHLFHNLPYCCTGLLFSGLGHSNRGCPGTGRVLSGGSCHGRCHSQRLRWRWCRIQVFIAEYGQCVRRSLVWHQSSWFGISELSANTLKCGSRVLCFPLMSTNSTHMDLVKFLMYDWGALC